MTTIDRTERFRLAIKAFIDQRREDKLKGLNPDEAAGDEEKRQKIQSQIDSTNSKYAYFEWLGDAAKRVGQIQAVTHVLKASHPDARGTSLNVSLGQQLEFLEIGSHNLGDKAQEDIVGNAAALDVYKMLKQEVDGQPLLYWANVRDADLESALSHDNAVASERLEAFASLVRNDLEPVSSPLAKQLYWLQGDDPTEPDDFHLLQPMFASSLLQVIHDDIETARYGEANKEARQARRKNEQSATIYRDYRNLVVRKLGGTKPQNVSQLNSERGGMNYLLPSLPPAAWTNNRQPRVKNQKSVFVSFRWFRDGNISVNDRIKELASFLKDSPDSVLETRNLRKAMEQELGQQIQLFASTIRYQQIPGWTRDDACQLPLSEQLWLDPERVELPVREESAEAEEADIDFNKTFARGDWPDEVAERFARWLNEQLRKHGLTKVGDAEHKNWAKQAIIEADWPVSIQHNQATTQGGEA